MPSPVSSFSTSVFTLENTGKQVQSVAVMGERTVITLKQSSLTTGLTGFGSASHSGCSKIDNRQIRHVPSPTGLSLIDQSNLTTLSHMEAALICQGILAIEELQELSKLAELISHTHHWQNHTIAKIIQHKASGLRSGTQKNDLRPHS